MGRLPKSVKLAALALCLPAAAGAAQFSDLLPGARPAGMGNAYTAVSNDVWGMFYNPAGLANAQFTAAGATLGRQLSPLGNLAYHAWGYARPFPILPGSTVGAGFLGLDQADGSQKNELLLHFSDALSFPQYYLPRPFGVGANFKVVQAAARDKGNKLGLALDGGVLFTTPQDLRLGLSVNDLSTGLVVPTPSLNVGTAWTWQRALTLSADLRVRPGLTQFFPGVEWAVYQHLLKLRVGKGFPLDGVSQVAFGVGADFSPLTIDFAMSVPSAGWNRPGGECLLSAQWRFGAPPFSGRFVGTAARRAEDLDEQIGELDRRRKDAEAKTQAAETDRESLAGQVAAEEERLRQLQQESRSLETDLERRRYDATHQQALPTPVVDQAVVGSDDAGQRVTIGAGQRRGPQPNLGHVGTGHRRIFQSQRLFQQRADPVGQGRGRGR
ncbi:MAG: hypothetical protein KGL53_16385, partial [Elusimicrobia bacterium]|nr:hypothetical protein [Elusimicrobiota bacterium]